MKQHRSWTVVGIIGFLFVLTAALLALNLIVQPAKPVHGADLNPSRGPDPATLPDAGTPEPASRLQVMPSGSSDDGTCTNPYSIACGGQDSRSTVGHNANLDGYSCQSGWDESGPEIVYTFSLPEGHTYTVTAVISDLGGVDLDVFLLDTDGCDSVQCLPGTNHDAMGDTAAAGGVAPGSYYISVDGFLGVSGTYTLDLYCIPTSNNPPNKPSAPHPGNLGTGVDLNPTLSWAGGDPDGDQVLYDVYGIEIGSGGGIQTWCAGVTNPQCDIGPLKEYTTYSWYVYAEDEFGEGTIGDAWQFTTVQDNNPPNKPSDPLPKDGATGVSREPRLSWTGGDPDIGDTVVYTVSGGLVSAAIDDLWCGNITKNICTPPYVLKPKSKYSWTVWARDQKGELNYSFWEFTTTGATTIYVPLVPKDWVGSGSGPAPKPTTPTPTSTHTPTPTPTSTLTPSPTPTLPATGEGIRFINHTVYPLISLIIDGQQYINVETDSILPNYYWDVDLGAGDHYVDAHNGWWENGQRVQMYRWQGWTTQKAGQMTVEKLEGPFIEELLPNFGDVRYWQGLYWTGELVEPHFAGFCFYKNNKFRYYDDGKQTDTGVYKELYRSPGLITFRVTNDAGTETYDGVFEELNDLFMMGNGPQDFKNIKYAPSSDMICPVVSP